MRRLPTSLIVNRAVLALFGAALLFGSAVAAYEILIALPACPGATTTCPMRDAHHAGGRLVAAAILALWVFILLWLMATRRQERLARPGAIAIFWTIPFVIGLQAVFILL